MFSPNHYRYIIFAITILLGACSGGGDSGPVPSYMISGTITGLNGDGLALQNGSTPVMLNGNTFSMSLVSGTDFDINVYTQPSNLSQICMVSNNATGKISSDIRITVNCITSSFDINGNITNLTGVGLSISETGNPVMLTGNTFVESRLSGSSYALTIDAQPATPNQTCIVDPATESSMITNTDINVSVNCLNHHILGGVVSGLLPGRSLKVQHSGSNSVMIVGNGAYIATSDAIDTMMYQINILNQPVAQKCGISKSSGSVTGFDITDINITCEDIGKKVDASSHLVTIKENGTLWAWGTNYAGQLGDSTTTARYSPVSIGTDTNWATIAATRKNTYALKTDGTLWGWGVGATSTPAPIGVDMDWWVISQNSALKTDGTLWTWTGVISPEQFSPDTDWEFVSSGENHSIAIKSNGTLWAWGANSSNQLGDGTNISQTSPVQIGTDNNWLTVVAGTNHTMAIKTDGTLWAWGANNQGQLGIGSTGGFQSTPIQVGTSTNWKNVDADSGVAIPTSIFTYHNVAIRTDGTLWAWGYNSAGELGDGSNTNAASPVPVGIDTDWRYAVAGYAYSFAIKNNGAWYSWGNNYFGNLGTGIAGVDNAGRIDPTQVGTDNDWLETSSGADISLAIKTDNTLWAWGRSFYFTFGDGVTKNNNAPFKVGTDTDWLTVSLNPTRYEFNIFALALKTNGTLWSWGYNNNGQLGSGDKTSTILLEQVGTDTDWDKISAGTSHGLAIKTDGTLWAWGNNNSGQLGDTSNTERLTPVKIGLDTDWTVIKAGSSYSIAIKTNGTLWTWGSNASYTLGDGTTTDTNEPTRVGVATNWLTLTANIPYPTNFYAYAVKTNGELWHWGERDLTAFGSSVTTIPTQVGTNLTWLQISSGFHTAALRTDGTIWSWGRNQYGELGNGSNFSSDTPVQSGTDTDWSDVSAGRSHSTALKTNNTLWSWGNNAYGLLGIGVTSQDANRNVPILVP